MPMLIIFQYVKFNETTYMQTLQQLACCGVPRENIDASETLLQMRHPAILRDFVKATRPIANTNESTEFQFC